VRTRLLVLTFAVLALLSLAIAGGVAGSEKSQVTATLTGYEETPGVSTTGQGTFEAVIDEEAATPTITFTLTYQDLTAPAAAAHIHFGNRFTAGGVSAFFCGGGSKPACPPGVTMTAVVTGTITPTDVIGPAGQGIAAGEFDELVQAIRAGMTYANVHTSNFGGGEIRGQINNNSQRQ
jgi:hypothetical protein